MSGKQTRRAAKTQAPKRVRRQVRRDEDRKASRLAFDPPANRPLKAYAFDPSQGTVLGKRMVMSVRYEELDVGPVVRDMYAYDGIAIVDYDASRNVYYKPIDLDDPQVLIRSGLDPVEGDPRFHQQMVYAVVTDTIQHFEAALGRRIHWRRAERDAQGNPIGPDIYTLNIYPHAMVAVNAFYSADAHGILFGYFRANETNQGRNLPGQIVYTCLSHDIVAHETTHAIIDGIRRHFTEQTNPDVAAFHEGFADLAALFRHFSHREVLLDAIQRTGGRLYEVALAADAPVREGDPKVIDAQYSRRNPLVDLAQQFGEATGRGQGLRSALTEVPNTTDIQTLMEPHDRGAILVSAVFDAYFKVYLQRTADLFRIFRAGGATADTDLPAPLASRLADEASRAAQEFFNICVRALDYCPPVDITFGDFLRALITADIDVHPTDRLGIRDAFLQAFRVRGIIPEGAASFSDTSIAWPRAKDLPAIPGLEIGDPNGMTPDEQKQAAAALTTYFKDPKNRTALGFDPKLEVTVASFHPVARRSEDGTTRIEMVIEAVQERSATFVPGSKDLGDFPMRGGATIIVGKQPLEELRRQHFEMGTSTPHAPIRYVIGKAIGGPTGERRERRQRDHYQHLGLVEGSDPSRFRINFALTHGGF